MNQDCGTNSAGVGMPATLHLNAFAREIMEAFGEVPFLVGSAARSKTWRDVDVRLLLEDGHFDRLFPAHTQPGRTDGFWSLICAAIAELGRQRTGLPIDFQIQRRTDANAQYNGVRHALGLYNPRGHDTLPPASTTTAPDVPNPAATDKSDREEEPADAPELRSRYAEAIGAYVTHPADTPMLDALLAVHHQTTAEELQRTTETTIACVHGILQILKSQGATGAHYHASVTEVLDALTEPPADSADRIPGRAS